MHEDQNQEPALPALDDLQVEQEKPLAKECIVVMKATGTMVEGLSSLDQLEWSTS